MLRRSSAWSVLPQGARSEDPLRPLHTPGGRVLQHEERERRAARAEEMLDGLREAGVVGVVLPWVDTSRGTRVRGGPLAKLPSGAAGGVGMSRVFAAFLFDDSIVAGRFAGSAVGDLRLHPALARLGLLGGRTGWG